LDDLLPLSLTISVKRKPFGGRVSGQIVDAMDDTFEEQVIHALLRALADKPTEGCDPSMMIAPMTGRVARV
jgi:hypothetical protein